MIWMNSTLFVRVEVKCWGSRVEGDRYARAGVSMNGQGDIEVEESGQKVGEEVAVPWLGIYPSIVCYAGVGVTSSDKI